jgi:predicted permease
VTGFLQDFRYAVRMLVKSPGFTIVAVVSLAFGIAANTAIFSLVNGLLLKPLPGTRPGELIAVFTSDYSGPAYGASSYPDFLDFREKNPALEGLAAYAATPVLLETARGAERSFAELVSANYFSLLGMPMAAGRGLLPEEDVPPGAHPVVVLSQRIWKSRFGEDPGLLGKTVKLNGRPFTVVGIARDGFHGMLRGFGADFWVPAGMDAVIRPGGDPLSRGNRSFFLVGRLKPNGTLAQARAGFDLIARRLYQAYPQNWTDLHKRPRRVTVLPESAARIFPAVRGPVLGFLGLLLTVVGLVLLIACANVANMLLARATVRRREIAVRLSLGAGRGRLMRQLLTESLLLASLAGVAGLLLALWAVDLLMAFQPPLPVPVALDFSVDARVLGFTLMASLFTGVVFGLAPALQASRPDLVPALKDETTSAAGPRRSRTRSIFVVTQVTLSLVLLVGSALFLRSLKNASTLDPGFDPNDIVLLSADLELSGYNEARGRELQDRIRQRAEALPGVVAAAWADRVPLSLGGGRRGVRIEGYQPRPGEDTETSVNDVGPGYFRTLKIPILRGREFTERDTADSPGVVIVNQAFADRYWPGQEPLGRRLTTRGAEGPSMEVVGVVRTGKYNSFGEEPLPFFYQTLSQSYKPDAILHVRTRGDKTAVLEALRAEARSIDPGLVFFDITMMRDRLGVALFPARVAGVLLGIFGLVALLLSAVGLYGVMSYSSSRRTREIGVRMALGARRADVVQLVVSEGARLAAIGTALGLVVSFVLTRLISGFLYGVSATDPAVFVLAPLVLLSIALLASYIPARRAAHTDPMIALRYE